MKKANNNDTLRVNRELKFIDEDLVTNTKLTASILGISTKTLQNWHKKGCPQYKRGWWNLREVISWSQSDNADENLLAKKLEMEVEVLRNRNEKMELENAIKREEYFYKDEVVGEWVRRISELRNSLLSLATDIASEITDKDLRKQVEDIVEVRIYEFLEQYSREGKYTPLHVDE